MHDQALMPLDMYFQIDNAWSYLDFQNCFQCFKGQIHSTLFI